jgi:hypothetical protein
VIAGASLRFPEVPHRHPRFRLGGLKGAQTEISLAAMVYKLKQMLNVLGGTRWRAALGVSYPASVRTRT